MGWFKGFGKKDRKEHLTQGQGRGHTFILEPILTPSGLVDDPTHTPPSLDFLSPDFSQAADLPPDLLALMNGVVHPDPTASPFNGGVFTVGGSGIVQIDYLYDGGGYQGELALFSLDGMEAYAPGSQEFIAEAARRALSDSLLGHIVIQDASEGARFGGGMAHEGDFNSGPYQGPKSVWMKPGSQFGVMLVPNGTVAQVLADPAATGALRPLFSLSTANPHDALGVGQIVDLTGDGHTFGMEDLRVDGASDRDYNDIVFRIKGASGQALGVADQISPLQDWRHTDLGHQILTPPQRDLPLVGIIDTGFDRGSVAMTTGSVALGYDWVDGDPDPLLDGLGSHGSRILQVIQSTQTQPLPFESQLAPTWIGRGVGAGNWAASLVEFVNHAVAQGETQAVVNLSFELTQFDATGHLMPRFTLSPQEIAALNYAQQHHVLLVVAAGNQGEVLSALGQASVQFDNIVTVGALDGGGRADYSGMGTGLTLLATGGTPDAPVAVATATGTTAVLGTSYATAEVTGAISLIWQANPALNYGQVIQILRETAQDLGAPGWDATTGFGALNVLDAIELAKRTVGVALPTMPTPAVDPATMGVANHLSGPEQATDDPTPTSAGNAQSLAGNTHIFWRNYWTGDNQVWVMNGTQVNSVIPLLSVAPNWAVAGLGDFNGDGKTDILWRETTEGHIGIWAMDGTHLLSTQSVFPALISPDWQIAGIADLNQDGKTDILWRHPDTGHTGAWLMDGTQLSVSTAIGTVGGDWQLRGSSDFNRDGHADLLWYYPPTGAVGTWFMEGATFSSALSLGSAPAGWWLGGAGNFNGDGHADLLWNSLSADDDGLRAAGIWLMAENSLSAVAQLSSVSSGWLPVAPFRTMLPAPPSNLMLQGSSANVTNSPNFIIQGQAEPYTLIKLTHSSGTSLGQVLADGQGHWHIPLSGLVEGRHTITAQAIDPMGVSSFASNPLNITIDLQAPAAPTQVQIGNRSDGYAVSNPLIRGIAEPDATVKFYSDGQLVGQTVAAADGTWVGLPDNPLPEGLRIITVTATDPAGNTSPASTPIVVMIDVTAPYFTLSTPLEGGSLTSATRLAGFASGTYSSLASLTYQIDNLAPVAISVGPNGTFDQLLNLTDVGNGQHTLTITAWDSAGIGTSQTFHVTVDQTPPDTIAPVLYAQLAVDTAVEGQDTDGLTSNPTIMGQATDNQGIARFEGRLAGVGGNFINLKPYLQPDGSFTLNRPQLEAIKGGALTDGSYNLQLQAEDEFGNSTQTTVSFTLDTIPPVNPTVTLSTDSDSGVSNSDRITKISSPVIAGVAEANSVVQVWVNGTIAGETTATAEGVWQFTPALSQSGVYHVSAIAIDLAGNRSVASESMTMTLDDIAPTLMLTDLGDQTTLSQRSSLTGTVNGTGSPITSLTYQFDNLPEIPVAVVDGVFDQRFDLGGIESGSYTLTVRATDAAGNTAIIPFNVTVLAAPILMVGLLQDTGMDNTDGVTNTPTIRGTVTSPQVTSVLVGFDNTLEEDFSDVINLVGTDGTFTLDADILQEIYQAALDDGEHTLRLKLKDKDGQNLGDFSVPFKLDTQSPTLIIDSLADGVTWENESLVGRVEGKDDLTRVFYTFNTSLNRLSSTSLHLGLNGVVNSPLTLPNTSGTHVFRVQAVDAAGNLSLLNEFSFLIPDSRPIVDTDILIDESGLPDTGNDPLAGNNWDPNAPAGPGGIWGFVGRGGSWGNWRSSGAGGFDPSPFPGFQPGAGDGGIIPGCDIPLTYRERVDTILKYGFGALSKDPEIIHKKAALKNRINILNEIAKITETNLLYEQMKPVMHGIFNDALLISSKCQAILEGYILAQDIAKDKTAVKIKTFQGELFAVVYQYLKRAERIPNSATGQKLDSALLALGETYAKLERNQVGSNAPNPSFIEQLWQLQMGVSTAAGLGSQFDRSADALTRALQGGLDPANSLIFVSNLLQAGMGAASLDNALRDDNFVQRLIDFGFKYANFTSHMNPQSFSEPQILNGLWFGNSKQVQAEVNSLFDGLETQQQRFNLMAFADNAIKMLQSSTLSHLSGNAWVLEQLIGLGSTYLALNSQPGAVNSELQSFQFLDSLFRASTPQGIEQAAQQFAQVLGGNEAFQLGKKLRFYSSLLRSAKKVQRTTSTTNLKQQFSQPAFIDQLIDLGQAYELPGVMSVNHAINPAVNFFLDTLYRERSEREVNKAAKELAAFLDGFDQPQERLQLLRLSKDLLNSAAQIGTVNNEGTNKRWSDLVGLGRAYALLEPTTPSTNRPLNFFLDTFYQARDSDYFAKGDGELRQFLQPFEFENRDKTRKLLALERTMLEALNLVKDPALQAQRKDPAFIQQYLELGRTYAFLSPQATAAGSVPLKFFLDTLYRADERVDIQNGAREFESLFKDPTSRQSLFNSPEERDGLLQFTNDILSAVKRIPSLAEQPYASVLNGLVKLGASYAALKPVIDPDSLVTETEESQLKFFLNTLWQAEGQSAIIQRGGYELASFLNPLPPPQQVQLLTLERNFLHVVRQTPELGNNIHNPTFLDNLAGLGKSYVALMGDSNSTASPHLFFDILWQRQEKGIPDAKTRFRQFVQAVSNSNANIPQSEKLDPDALFFGIRLLLTAKGSTLPGVESSSTHPPLTLAGFDKIATPLAQVAREYANLDPQTSSTVLGFFLNTVWGAANTGSISDLAKIEQGAEEFRDFLGTNPYFVGFDPLEQPQVLEFVAKLLKFVDLSPRVTAEQKQNPDLLRRWIAMGRAYAKARPSNPSGTNIPDYGINNLPPDFLKTLWNTPLDNDSGIEQSIAQLNTLLQRLEIDDQFWLADLSSKLMSAVSHAVKKLPEHLAEFLNNPFVILFITGIIAATVAILTKPGINLIASAVLGALDLVFTVLTGSSFAIGLVQFALLIGQADANDDEAISQAGDKLANVFLDAAGLAGGVLGAIKFVPRLLQTFKALRFVRSVDEFQAVTGFLSKFGENQKLAKFLDEADEAGFRYLIDLASHLKRKSEGVADVLLNSSKTLDEILSKEIDDAKALIDELSTILNRSDIDERLLVELLEIPNINLEVISRSLKGGLSPQQIESLAPALGSGYRPQSVLDILEIAAQENVIIRTRPTNPEAPRLRDEGFAAKPLYVKSKSINEYDTYIGARKEDIGKVGYFEPTLDSNALDKLDPQIREKIINRFDRRASEYANLSDSIERALSEGMIRLENGLVINNVQGSPGFGKPFTGDIDTFDILDSNGQPVSLEKQLQVMDKLRNRVDDVTHNHHMEPGWGEVYTDPNYEIKQSIIQQHTFGTTSSESLVEYRPDGTVGRSYYGNPSSPRILN